MTITPNRDQFKALAATAATDDTPVVMLNLLKFKEVADAGGRGVASYNRYGDAVTRMVEERGGRVLWTGRVDQVLIGSLEASETEEQGQAQGVVDQVKGFFSR